MEPSDAIASFYRWAQGYFSGAEGKLSSVVNVDEPPPDKDTPWAWGLAPLAYQHADEVEEFLKVVLEQGLNGCALEIGLENGGLHIVLREVFSKVISIEKSRYKVLNFLSHTEVDQRSVVVCGDSLNRKTRQAVEREAQELDLLFIDGDHGYTSVYSDYMLYRGMVRPGGIVAFHDSAGRDPAHAEVQVFLSRLRAGEIDSASHSLSDIIRSGTGISYEVAGGKR